MVHQCEICQKEFKQRNHLANHKRLKHEEAAKEAAPVDEKGIRYDPVTVKFNQKIEVILNGVSYNGREITVQGHPYEENLKIASQIVSTAQEFYGTHVVA